MKKCSLCGRKMNSSNGEFGLNCLKKVCNMLDIKDIKKLNGEKVLNKQVQKILNKNKLPNTQQKMLTNRYLTLKILEQIDMDYYENIRQAIRKDIEKINNKTSVEDLETMNTMPLKYANEILRLYLKHNLPKSKLDYNEKINYTQNILFNTMLFGFSYYYNKKSYLSGILQEIQMWVWNMGIDILKNNNCQCSARFLKHSLQNNPQDVIIKENDLIINKIKNDDNFKKRIKSIIKKHANKKSFNTEKIISKEDKKYLLLNYKDKDLTYALNNTSIYVKGEKINKKWSLQITIKDVYDFTDFKELQEFIGKSLSTIVGLFANNMAMISTSCGLMNPYNVIIKFKMDC